jgi:hypothetical protein
MAVLLGVVMGCSSLLDIGENAPLQSQQPWLLRGFVGAPWQPGFPLVGQPGSGR